MRIVNPTGMPPRLSDKWGVGSFGAHRDGGKRVHLGLDMQASPGQFVYAPIGGLLVREKRPYGDGGEWDTGVLIAGDGEWAGCDITLFYCRPMPTLIGRRIEQGQAIALAQSLQGKYQGITDHIHLGVQIDGGWVDPAPYLLPLGGVTA